MVGTNVGLISYERAGEHWVKELCMLSCTDGEMGAINPMGIGRHALKAARHAHVPCV